MSGNEEDENGDPLSGWVTSQKFLVFSLPRCGSTTLRRILNCHPRLRCLEEPFNPFNYDGKYIKPSRTQLTRQNTSGYLEHT
jgi:hypothetical protein